jgi:hypothetical protein
MMLLPALLAVVLSDLHAHRPIRGLLMTCLFLGGFAFGVLLRHLFA